MANPEQLTILDKGIDAWNAWRRNADQATAIDLNGANLQDMTLRWAKPGGSVSLGLSYANLSFANLTSANLSFANLKGANLSMTLLTSTNFTGADLGYTLFAFCDEVFLSGAGFPDAFITYARSLIGSAIEFYSCFISYSTNDQEFARRLYADLQAKSVRCWFAPHDMRSGRKLYEQIDEAIRVHDKLLLILSPHSMSSEWVQTEISKARKREIRDKARVLFPISLAPFHAIRDWELFDADTGKDSAREIREYFIPDFSNQKDHDSYQEAFERLVKGLKAPAEKQ